MWHREVPLSKMEAEMKGQERVCSSLVKLQYCCLTEVLEELLRGLLCKKDGGKKKS